MDEIEQVSDEIAVIDEGRIILHDAKEAILMRADAVLIRVGEMGEAAVAALGAACGDTRGKGERSHQTGRTVRGEYGRGICRLS